VVRRVARLWLLERNGKVLDPSAYWECMDDVYGERTGGALSIQSDEKASGGKCEGEKRTEKRTYK
jgi:hypothetical protein